MNALTVTHSGLGNASDIEHVYVIDGQRRISRTVSLSNTPASATLRLGALRIPACGTRTLSIVADFSRDASPQGEHRLAIASFADVSADTTEIRGTLASQTGTTRVAPVSDGTINVEYLPVLSSVTYGNARTLLRLRLTAQDQDQLVYGITLTNDGKARDTDLRSLSLGTRTATLTDTLPSLDGDTARFTFVTPLRLEKGEDILLLVTGDVRASRRKTIDFKVEEAGDIDAGKATR